MSDNPYQAPPVIRGAVGVNSGRFEDVRKVALYQKGVLVCILFQFLGLFFQFMFPPELILLPALGVVLSALAGTVFVILLAINVYNLPIGILLGVFTLLRCLGLIVLLLINGKATSVLRRNGLRVGLLGVKLSQISG
jgi:hypothetical protein